MLSIDLIPWWAKAAVLGLIITAVFSSGVYFESLRWSKADGKAKLASAQASIDLLKKNVAIISNVLQVDSTQALADATTMDDLERITNALIAKTPDTACFGPSDTDGLRDLFSGKK